jgi:hypothetical protein
MAHQFGETKAAQLRPSFFCEFCEVAGMEIIIQKRWPQPNLHKVKKFKEMLLYFGYMLKHVLPKSCNFRIPFVQIWQI